MPTIAERPATEARPAPAAKPRPVAGENLVYLCGGALGLCLLLVAGLLGILAINGLGVFWPSPVAQLKLKAGGVAIGEITGRQPIPHKLDAAGVPLERVQIKIGNRDVNGLDFQWFEDAEVAETTFPADLVAMERLEYGNFYGRVLELRKSDGVVLQGDAMWNAVDALHAAKVRERDAIHRFESGELGRVTMELEDLRLESRRCELRLSPEENRAAQARIDAQRKAAVAKSEDLFAELEKKRSALMDTTLKAETAGGKIIHIPLANVVRMLRPNTLSTPAALGVYFGRMWEFLSAGPRESNTEGGVFPAIFGTVLMVFLMSIAVVPLGVLAALYLREYAKQGLLVRCVRIAVNNLAGVPSIVFGVFGLGFFVYLIGGTIDQLFYPEYLPAPKFGTGGILWASLTLALLTVPVVIVATEEGLAAVPRNAREGSLALGATKFETTWRVVVPAAAPGILTGLILAMARASGEVAPLMIVGMVKLAPALPVSMEPPFLHLERKFMHLGFHIYDVGFQSPNVEATKPLVFATAFLLILMITIMNLIAITLRNRLRKRYAGSAV